MPESTQPPTSLQLPGTWVESLASLLSNLRRLVDAIRGQERRWACVVEFQVVPGYLQLQGYPDGALLCEVASDANLPAGHSLSAADQLRLKDFGWRGPDAYSPNWYIGINREEGDRFQGLPELVRATAVEIYHVPTDSDLEIRTFEAGGGQGSGMSDNQPMRLDPFKEPTPRPASRTKPLAAPKERSLMVVGDHGRIRIVDDKGHGLIAADSAEELVRTAAELDESPLVLARGSNLTLLISSADRARILDALRPCDQLAEQLDKMMDDQTDGLIWLSALRTGNKIDGQPWGWLRREDQWGSEYCLLPAGRGVELARFDAWMSASMTGANISYGLRHWGHQAVIWVDNDPDPDHLTPYFELESIDGLLEEVFYWEDPLCPTCESESASGWEIGFWVSPVFPEKAIGRAMTNVWVPCEQHRGRVDLEVNADRWRWSRGLWHLVGPADP